MASPTERRRNNVRAGVFVSAAIVVAAGIIVALTGAWEQFTTKYDDYTVRYDVASGVKNIKRGGEVRVGGHRMGTVVDVRPVPGQPFESIDIDFTVNRAVTLYGDASVYISAPVIGTDAWLDVANVGNPAVPAGGVIMGASPAGGMLGALLGPAQAHSAKSIITNAEEFTGFLASIDDEYESRVVPIIDNLAGTTGDARELVQRIKDDDWPEWAASVDRVAGWAVGLTDKIDAAVADGHGLMSDTRAMVTRNRSGIDATVDRVQSASVTLDDMMREVQAVTLERANELIATGQKALDQAVAGLETLRRDYDGWSVDIGESMASARLASQQLKLTLLEVRRSPWKVLYRPTDQEIEHELLYDAARSFALATADLRAASNTMNTILERHPDALAASPDLQDRVTLAIRDPLERYEAAQKRLLDVIFAGK